MPVAESHQFPGDAFTPICGSCGVALCWDISIYEYVEDFEFWEAWECEGCHGSRMHPKIKTRLIDRESI